MATTATIVNEINHAVNSTGYPVPTSIITTAKLADRKTLRKLVRQGVLNQLQFVTQQKRVENGYYADIFPARLAKALPNETESTQKEG